MEAQTAVKRPLPEGATVKIVHYRRYLDKAQIVVDPKGGETLAIVTLPDESQFAARARCSERDNFNRRIGRDIALGRVLKEIYSREEVHQ